MGTEHVTALIYVAAFVPGSGEPVGALVAKFPDSTVNESLRRCRCRAGRSTCPSILPSSTPGSAAQECMATRANATVEVVEGASHMVFVSHPDVTAAFIQRAAAETAS
ncbi:hypothetical protein GCM10023194_28050 [Planotetraspora phitsanulokensis]|uniref:Alpha/beta hydrolase n=1 Tax=Planotetraspora phitsanulokensis TaxID=575192 RepID=A0A8J3U099_9ACTN|nr:hypothetical protein [Planotetraspora phitsanulokensis]GII36058.1 hypothetical protein Pph01_10610 [Planotetraspora phitsanulokensis]